MDGTLTNVDPADRGGRGGDGAVDDLREAVAAYVRALHRAYLTAGGGRGDAGLAAGRFTVVAAAAHSLHLLATRDEIAVPETGRDQPAQLEGLAWTLVFLDPSVLPDLAAVPSGPGEPLTVRETVGAGSTLYHLVVGQGSMLTSHHAMHAGTGIAHRERRDVEEGDAPSGPRGPGRPASDDDGPA